MHFVKASIRYITRKAKAAYGQPEARMIEIALGGVGTVRLLLWLNQLPASSLAIDSYPYGLAAGATAGLAIGFYHAWKLKRVADGLPSVWDRLCNA